MNDRPQFEQYRGNGTTRDGRAVSTPGEKGRYLASKDLAAAVNTSLAVGQPLLVTGEAGTGKSVLAHSVAAELEMGDVLVFNVRSDHQGRDLLYEFDNLQRFYDAQVQDPKARDRKNYLNLGALGRAIVSDTKRMVLIDEIDKAPRDFPNDLLAAIDLMELRVDEIDYHVCCKQRPAVVITSNRESQLPDPFLRRCVFQHIDFPDQQQLQQILGERLGDAAPAAELLKRVVEKFLALREIEGLQKKPATGELLTWVRVLIAAGVPESALDAEVPRLPYLGTVLKTREDLDRVQRRAR